MTSFSFFQRILLTALFVTACASNAYADLGISTEYNVFVEQDLSSRYSQVQGRVAAGGNVSLTGYAVATEVTNTDNELVMVVGQNLSLTSVQVNNGSVTAGGDVSEVSAVVISALAPGATLQGLTPPLFSFQTEFFDLNTKSSILSVAQSNGFVEYLYGGVRLSGDCVNEVQIFNIDGNQLANSNHVVVSCIPENATVILNVDGESNVGFKNIGLQALNNWSSSLIWNFHKASDVSLANVEVIGLLLAPNADVNTTFGAVRGTVISKSWSGSFALKNNVFDGNLSSLLLQVPIDSDSDGVNDELDQCPDTPIGEVVTILGCSPSQLDSDLDGVNDELDQCSATLEGEVVDSQGCALNQLDSDNDGVNDTLDQCPLTPQTETANDQGCGVSQLDEDGDGVNNGIDQCPSTLSNETVDAAGCSENQIDTDGDGILDNLDAFPNDANESTDLDGDGIGDNADTDRDGDDVLNDVDAFPNDSTESVDTDGDGIGDNTDTDIDGDGVANVDDFFPEDPESSTVPSVQITSPASLITVGSSPLRITGTVDDLNARLVINGIEIAQNNGSFEADVVIDEGTNNIFVRAIDENNHEGIATITVSLDRTPPFITLQSPVDGGTVFTETISVSGLVNDIVRGTISEDEANVQIVTSLSNVEASVSNRSYLAEDVRLNEGENQITITASDAVGNINSEIITVTYQPQIDKVISLVSGNAQSAEIKTSLSEPLVVGLFNNGQPVVDKTVVFRVVEGDGLLQPDTDAEGNGAVVRTNAAGLAQVNYKLGARAGTGNQKVMARAVGFDGEIQFFHSAVYSEGVQMGVIAGNNQRGSVRQPLAQPLVLAVTDIGANLIPNTPVEFSVSNGTGTFSNGEKIFVTNTDLDGRASASYVLGREEGIDVQRVTARLVNGQAVAEFTISGFLPGDPGNTKISGIILDNDDLPIPGVIVRVDNTTRQAISDIQGQFIITEAPVGPVHLIVEGGTTSRDGEWPSLSYNIVTVPGVNNPLARPVYLVQLDVENSVHVGLEDVIVTHPDLPGFELDVKAGSVTFPDGAKEGLLSVTQVNSSKVPMLPPNGMQPQLIVTIQPSGAQFDPPARLTIPNTDGHSPLAEIEMFSFDHDLEEFVTIGIGTVSKDGSVISSNVGSGVVKAGWHCGSQPGGSGCCRPRDGGGGGCPVCQNPANGACDGLGGDACVPVDDELEPETVCTYCQGGKEIKANGPLLDSEGEDIQCLICDDGVETNAPDNSFCDDDLFCTNFEGGGLGGTDLCSGGQCVGKVVERSLLSEDRLNIDLLGVAGFLARLQEPIETAFGLTVELNFSSAEQVWSECCESTDSNDQITAEETNVTLTGAIEPDDLPAIPIGIPGVTVQPVIGGSISGSAYGRSFDSSCPAEKGEDSCADPSDVEIGVQLSGILTGGIQFNLISPRLLNVSGTVSGGITGAGFFKSCQGFDWQACIGPPTLTGRVFFFGGVSRSYTRPLQNYFICANSDQGVGPTQ